MESTTRAGAETAMGWAIPGTGSGCGPICSPSQEALTGPASVGVLGAGGSTGDASRQASLPNRSLAASPAALHRRHTKTAAFTFLALT